MREKIDQALASLAAKRPIFHSEADLQHALAWELRATDPSLDVRLEVPLSPDLRRCYVDMIIRVGERCAYVELKYKTREMRHLHEGEDFDLKNQGAIDQGAYDILKDVQRIESFVAMVPGSEGFVIVISNDPRYWSEPPIRSKPTIDEAFKLTEGRRINGVLNWHPTAGAGSIKGRESPLKLNSLYSISWKSYSTTPEPFRCLSFHVACTDPNGEIKQEAVPASNTHLPEPVEEFHSCSAATRIKTEPAKKASRESKRHEPNWQRVLQTVERLGGVGSLDRIRTRFAQDYPDRKVVNVRHELVLMSVNHPKRIHYGQAQKPRLSNSDHPVDKLFHRSDGNFELYSPTRHGIWEIFLKGDGDPEVRQAAPAMLG